MALSLFSATTKRNAHKMAQSGLDGNEQCKQKLRELATKDMPIGSGYYDYYIQFYTPAAWIAVFKDPPVRGKRDKANEKHHHSLQKLIMAHTIKLINTGSYTASADSPCVCQIDHVCIWPKDRQCRTG